MGKLSHHRNWNLARTVEFLRSESWSSSQAVEKGVCQTGVKFTAKNCIRKIVGARYFSRRHEAAGKMGGSSEEAEINDTVEFRSARDADGHVTHTASTAVRRYSFKARISGYTSGITKGVAPKAKLAFYKACWKNADTFGSYIIVAFDTVGAGTFDRNFTAEVLLRNGKKLAGVSLYEMEIPN